MVFKLTLFASCLLVFLFLEIVHSSETTDPPSGPVGSSKKKGKGISIHIGVSNDGKEERGKFKNSGGHGHGHDDPEMKHLMSSLVSLLPDEMEHNLRSNGFNVLLDKHSKSGSGDPPGIIHGNAGDENDPNVHGAHFGDSSGGNGWPHSPGDHYGSFGGGSDANAGAHDGNFGDGDSNDANGASISIKIDDSNSKKRKGSKGKKSQGHRERKKNQEANPYIITMARIQKPELHFSSTPIKSVSSKSVRPGQKRNPDIEEISTLEIDSKAQFSTIKFRPVKEEPPRRRKVTKPIIILLDDIVHEEEPKHEDDHPKSHGDDGHPDLSSLYHIISMLEQNQGHPVSVLPSSKSKDLEDSIYCIKCTAQPLNSDSDHFFDFDVLPQLLLSDSGINAMGTPFDVIGNRLVKRETGKESKKDD